MSFWSLLKAEIKAVLTNEVVMLTMFGGVIFYSFLYPLPYQNQTPLEQPISVVNLDGSSLSHQLERMVDATPQVKVVQRDYTIEAAKQDFLDKKISGILVIPEHFHKDILLGKSVTLSYAGDATYFLVYGTIVEGLAQAGGTLAAQAKVSRLLIKGEPFNQASKQYAPTLMNMKPTFNPTIGYMNYVVPAVFMLILQQTLAMAAGLLGGTQRLGKGYWSQASVFRLMSVRVLVLGVIYYVLSMYYFGFGFEFHEVVPLGSQLDSLMMLLPFLLTTIFIGIWLGNITPRREWVTAIVLMSSLPLVFTAGFIWPKESMPALLVWLSHLFPTMPVIQGFLGLNQMGASWAQVLPYYLLLWGQSLFWGWLAYRSLLRQSLLKRV